MQIYDERLRRSQEEKQWCDRKVEDAAKRLTDAVEEARTADEEVKRLGGHRDATRGTADGRERTVQT